MSIDNNDDLGKTKYKIRIIVDEMNVDWKVGLYNSIELPIHDFRSFGGTVNLKFDVDTDDDGNDKLKVCITIKQT